MTKRAKGMTHTEAACRRTNRIGSPIHEHRPRAVAADRTGPAVSSIRARDPGSLLGFLGAQPVALAMIGAGKTGCARFLLIGIWSLAIVSWWAVVRFASLPHRARLSPSTRSLGAGNGSRRFTANVRLRACEGVAGKQRASEPHPGVRTKQRGQCPSWESCKSLAFSWSFDLTLGLHDIGLQCMGTMLEAWEPCGEA